MARLAVVALALGVLGGVPVRAEQAPKDGDATVDGFLSALKRGDFKAAASHFDANLKTALPPKELASVWKSETEKFGTLVAWTPMQKATADGKDVRLIALKFEHGESRMILSITPATQELAGISFAPVPAPAPANP
jgi:hypothetical protein